MKNIFLTAAISVAALSTPTAASAQFAYNFSKLNQAYAPLSGATSLSKNKVWTADSVYKVPLGFSCNFAGTPVSNIYFGGGNYLAPAISAVQSGFIMLGTGLIDRGAISGISKSDIRYSTTGATGSRIFKLEVHNAGFDDELLNNGELKDSISLQFWLYEGSNIAEFRYGSSMVSNFSDYFGPNLMCGYMKNMDTATTMFEKFYLLNGSAASPALDSLSGTFGNKGLSSVPASGTVFRFTPKGASTTGVHQVAAGSLATVFPTDCRNELQIRAGVGRIQYSILSTTGQLLSTGTTSGSTTTVDISMLAAGTYLVKLSDGYNAYEVQKVVKH